MSNPSAKSNLSGYAALVRGNSDFRNLWFGQIVSLGGDWFNLIATAALTARFTGSGAAVGTLFAIRWLAPFAASFFSGVATDRYNRKTLLILTDLTRAVTAISFLLARGPDDLWLLFALTAVQLFISGFFFPARNAILPGIVKPEELGAANALSSATWSAMLAFGAALGGIAAGKLGLYAAFKIDSASFLISAFFISRIRKPANPGEGEPRKPGAGIAMYKEGLKYLAANRDTLAIALIKPAFFIGAGSLWVIQVKMAEEIYPYCGGSPEISLGILLAIGGVGTGIGPIVARRLTGDSQPALRRALALSFPLMAFGTALSATLWSYGIVLLGIFLRGLGGGVMWVFTTQLLMQIVPDRMRGRVFGTEFALFTLMSAISAAIGGWALDYPPLGVAGSLWCVAFISILPGIFWSWHIKRNPGQSALA